MPQPFHYEPIKVYDYKDGPCRSEQTNIGSKYKNKKWVSCFGYDNQLYKEKTCNFSENSGNKNSKIDEPDRERYKTSAAYLYNLHGLQFTAHRTQKLRGLRTAKRNPQMLHAKTTPWCPSSSILPLFNHLL
jgi:hypothetical protein